MADDTFTGMQDFSAGTSELNAMDFVIRRVLGRTATATLVQVKAVRSAGEVAAVGTVDVQPMVAMLDGKGQATAHGTIYDVPFVRLQGGVNAVIIDPVVGDIGICVFASHDLSSVKANKAPSNPGSRRRFSMSDGLYIGGVLNGTPEQYIRFTSDGDVEIKPASKVTILGDVIVTGGDVTADGISLKTHTHSDPQGGDTGAPT